MSTIPFGLGPVDVSSTWKVEHRPNGLGEERTFSRLWPGLGLGLPAGTSRDLVGGDVQLTVLAAGGEHRHTDTPDTGVLDHASMLLREG